MANVHSVCQNQGCAQTICTKSETDSVRSTVCFIHLVHYPLGRFPNLPYIILPDPSSLSKYLSRYVISFIDEFIKCKSFNPVGSMSRCFALG